MLLRPQCQQDVSRRCREVGVQTCVSAAVSGAVRYLEPLGEALGERDVSLTKGRRRRGRRRLCSVRERREGAAHRPL